MARILKLGCAGEDVADWQRFLGGYPIRSVAIDGKFGEKTCASTCVFQALNRLHQDGIVGPETLRAARAEGFEAVPPVMKSRLQAMSNATRTKRFGRFAFESASTPGRPESIRITDGFARKNIIRFSHPGLPKSVRIHRLIRPQLKAALDEVAKHCSGVILTVNGGFVPRLRRGKRVFRNDNLSAHSWGSAIDLNAQWNRMGCAPARLGEKGTLRPVVDIFESWGFYWGGRFSDGMHFEAFDIVKDVKARLAT